jgi:glyoxylase-like metal-dependent hydrolase (beta-lactamase superfamily II)
VTAPVGDPPPYLSAGNTGPFTLDGTRTYRVGSREVVLLDPGPDVVDHVRALVAWVADADAVRVVVTHGHADHAGCATAVAQALGAPVHGPATVEAVTHPLADGDEVDTDAGTLVAVHTPGHTADHLSFLWRERRALFVGDLLLGRGDTTWVGEYPGCVADYLASLRRVRSLAPVVFYPAHGPPVGDVPATLDRYERHRLERIAQVEAVLEGQPHATADELVLAVYGDQLPSLVRRAAAMSLQALLDHVRAQAAG